jgi:inosine-uridine nucleoside N-ribohydrolase
MENSHWKAYRVTARLLCGIFVLAATAVLPAAPVRLIFDTDIGNDVDDALALAMIHALESRGEATLLAVTVTKDNIWAGPYVDLVNTFYGRPDIPIGTVRDGKTRDDGRYLRQISQSGLYPHRLTGGSSAPDAVLLLRRVLAAEQDGAVVIVQTGFCTNLARLLTSPPDGISSLTGRELVRRKVRFISLMGGNFATNYGGDYNIVNDLDAAKALFKYCPVPLVVSGYEIGRRILYPATSIERDFGYTHHHPVREAYRLYSRMPYDRPTWDLTSVLYAVRPEHSFHVSEPGYMEIADDARIVFTAREGGLHRYLRATQQECVSALTVMTALVTQPPKV